MKTISFEEAKPGDWLVSDGGSVRVEVVQHDHKTGYIFAKDAGNAHGAKEWQRLGFHVEREDPPKPRVLRVEMVWSQNPRRFENPDRDRDVFNAYSDNVIRKDMPYYEDGTPFTALIFPADLLEELDEAARAWRNEPSKYDLTDVEHAFCKALAACGIGTARAEGDER